MHALSARLLAAFASTTLLGTLAVGCTVETEESADDGAESAGDEINGGQAEPGYGEVGMLRFATGNFGSATLIAPKVVLTAAHVALGKPKQFYFGSPAKGKTPTWSNLTSVAVAEYVVHPCYGPGGSKPAGCDRVMDVAVVRLVEAPKGISPRAMESNDLRYFFGLWSPLKGDTCTAVGFGAHLKANKKATIGTRRSAQSLIADITKDEVETTWVTGIATSGDSGGPLICNGKIVGTVRGAVTVGPGGGYERTREGYLRIDHSYAWAQSYVTKWK